MGVAGYKYMLDEGFVANSTFNVTNGCYNPELDLVVDIPVRIFLPFHTSAVQVDCMSATNCVNDTLPPPFHPLQDKVIVTMCLMRKKF